MTTQDADPRNLPGPRLTVNRGQRRQLLFVSILLVVWAAFLVWQAVDP